MKDKELLLSISIPTYNRKSTLERTLHRLIQEVEKYNLFEEVEIVISDNSSLDGTDNLIFDIKNKTAVKITYNKNETNLGVIKNILKLVELSKGRYWMFYGDDDLIPEGSLPELVKLFQQRSYPIYMFKQFGLGNSAFKEYASEHTLSMTELARDYFYYIGNAGIFAVETKLAKKVLLQNQDNLLSTCWPQTEIIFIAGFISDKKEAFASTIPTAHNDYENLRYCNSYYYFETQLYSLIRSGLSINAVLKNNFIDIAKKSIFGIQFFDTYKVQILEEFVFFDLDYEKEQFEKTLSEAVEKIPSQYSKEILFINRLVKKPEWVKKIILYEAYLKRTLKVNLKVPFINKIKILSPFGYLAMIKNQKEEKATFYSNKGAGITEHSGYF